MECLFALAFWTDTWIWTFHISGDSLEHSIFRDLSWGYFDLAVKTLKLELLNVQKFEETSLIVWGNVVTWDMGEQDLIPTVLFSTWLSVKYLSFWEQPGFGPVGIAYVFEKFFVSCLCHRSCRWMHDASRSCARPFLMQHKSSSTDAVGISIIVSHFLFNSVWNELGKAEEWLNS